MNPTEQLIRASMAQSRTRADLWVEFVRAAGVMRMLEIGVYRGDFAVSILEACSAIERYYMIDPWRHLAEWNKPANESDDVFERFLAETVARTDFAAAKRSILRGKTSEVIDGIPDGELDFAYIDGDHTLKGITIDLMRVLPKVRAGGWIGGDDFSRGVWQHETHFEPTLVFPFAVYFAEAIGARIYAMPHAQFLIEKTANSRFAFIDLVGNYSNVTIGDQLHLKRMMRRKLVKAFPWVAQIANRVHAR